MQSAEIKTWKVGLWVVGGYLAQGIEASLTQGVVLEGCHRFEAALSLLAKPWS